MGSTPSQTSYTYNKDRQLTAVTRPDGTSMPLAYDSAGRLATVTVPRGTLTYAYDATKGTLSTVSSPDGVTLAYAYDGSLLTSTTWSGAVSGSVTRTYDNDFRVTSRSVNGGDSASLSYDADGLLTGAGQLVVSRDTTTGFIDGTMLGADLVSAMSYSGFGELAGMATSYGGSSQYSTTYTRDAGGRITPLDETVVGEVRQVNYHYDAAGRLERVTEDGVDVATYTYDDNGNRLSGTDALGTVVTGSYDDQDRLTAYGSATYSYTANGDLLSKTTPAGTASYSYDALGNLTAVTLAVGTAIEYRVDGQNRRVGKKVGGVLVKAWLYKDRLNPIAELDGAGAVVSRFVYGTKPHVPDYMVKGGVTYRIVSDHLGSVRLVIDAATGAVAQRIDYDAFGQVELDTAPGFQPFGFAGGLYDAQTGLVRFGARDYDAEVGRWTAKDPIRFDGGANLYGYALSNPPNLVDRNGLRPTWPSAMETVTPSGGIKWNQGRPPPEEYTYLDPAADPVAGFGDYLTSGFGLFPGSLTELWRKAHGVNDVIDPCSAGYRGGEYAALAWGFMYYGGSAIRGAMVGKLPLHVFFGQRKVPGSSAMFSDILRALNGAWGSGWVTSQLVRQFSGN